MQKLQVLGSGDDAHVTARTSVDAVRLRYSFAGCAAPGPEKGTVLCLTFIRYTAAASSSQRQQQQYVTVHTEVGFIRVFFTCEFRNGI